MAKLVTVVQTYFRDGRYRNTRVEMQIPDEAAEIIRKYWQEKEVSVTAKYLASNQAATAELFKDETLLEGIANMWVEDMDEDEVFEHRFKSDEEDEDNEQY